jgi:CHAT domain-containing protein
VRGDQDERPRFLIEEFNVSYAPSLAALAHFGQRESARTGPGETLLAIGDPRGEAGSIFSSLKGFFDEGRDREEETSPFTSGSEGFPRLKHSGDEVRRIAETFPENRRKILVESAAREETVKQELRLPWDIVHFAVHGIYDDYSPELSGIVLSSSEDRDDDGFLLADEIRDMELDASLVVLSGCETGLGRFVRGEGVVGLSRALFEAGASSILASLWGIGDESTAEFMEEFYRTYRGGAGKSSALSAVKRNMIQEGKPVSVWAPFVLLGDPR